LIEEDLQNFLLTQYAGQGITVNENKSIILQLKSLPTSDLYESNKTFLRMLSDGFILKREDRNQIDIYIQLIAYSGFAPYEFFYAWRRVAGLAKDVDGCLLVLQVT
jgi:type I restriction enzyme R subunit